jgi:hypothetical protein
MVTRVLPKAVVVTDAALVVAPNKRTFGPQQQLRLLLRRHSRTLMPRNRHLLRFQLVEVPHPCARYTHMNVLTSVDVPHPTIQMAGFRFPTELAIEDIDARESKLLLHIRLHTTI